MIVSAPWIAYPEISEKPENHWSFSEPKAEDGDDVYKLIANCPPLDVNSSYCNFLQATHFSQTCILVRYKGEVAGFASAYRKPQQPNTLFVWQVAVSSKCRGLGLASQMIEKLLARKHLSDITAVETTITQDNQASWALFKKLDAHNGQHGHISTFLDENTHFKGKHDTEYLYHIPLNTTQ
ncbi:2,4-diaminobutyric acid acetyltransferase [Vibrio galatheae]|uniref:L-2,4-diaminobutyric acid acetyltransferase n=1 Tax=Vibrio galatheae TaxID=579748 RepID=A0A0F4NH12_9VIBR|nr:diaminobutyrate acetyltransferase [Vibrio galatheae]KJY82133.1 2,4-diaminobutyric acid acetyltransferase [Vibrio galatheae]